MKTGRQTPTFEKIGDYAYSYGAEVADMFAEDGGATFYPAQLHELELMLARNADGSPAATTIGLTKPRQNGKSYTARYYAIYMAVFEHRDVLYSAHHSTTTAKMFKAMCDLFESPERFPEFFGDVKRVSHARGYEGIYFNDWVDDDGTRKRGGCIEFATRTNNGSRGGTYSVIIIDEAQEMTTAEQEAMLPTASAASDIRDKSAMPQQIYIGTPPSPTCTGTVFRKMRDSAKLRETDAWWLEWSIDSASIFDDLENRDNAIRMAYEVNPAMGYRIAEETVKNEYDTMSRDGFARERLGWYAPKIQKTAAPAIDPEVWEACASDDPKPEGKTAYGIKFSYDSTEVVLCGAVCPKDGPARISMIERRPTGLGIRWLADWLNHRVKVGCCVVIDGKNGVDVLIERIAGTWKAKNSVIRPKANDMIAAVSLLMNELSEKTVTWYREQDSLKDSALSVVKRPISGGWGFGGDDAIPIEAAALALWGCRNSKRDPTKQMRIG